MIMIMIMMMMMMMMMIMIIIRPGKRIEKTVEVQTRVVPIVIGALGTIAKGLVGHLESIGVNLDVVQIQKTTSLGIA